MAEWWRNEEGGYFCSSCGWYYDDYYDPKMPTICKQCGSKLLSTNDKMEIDRHYRLSKGLKWVAKNEYPAWLLDLNKKYGLPPLK